jgi:hypothetical protein
MNKGTFVTGGIALMAAWSIAAADNAGSNYGNQSLRYDMYRANEFSLDAFGTDTLGQHTINHPSTDRIRNNSVLGLGLGANYFFIRYVGIGAEAYTENTAHNFVDNASGNLIVRFPIGDTGLAPYAYGGGGYRWDPVSTWFGQVGGGLEFRFTRNIGIFVDARYVLADRIRDYGVGRAGLRFAF